jgi:large subunit ribosomal protein L24
MSNRFKPKFNIKKGDQVVVIAGDDKDLKKATYGFRSYS